MNKNIYWVVGIVILILFLSSQQRESNIVASSPIFIDVEGDIKIPLSDGNLELEYWRLTDPTLYKQMLNSIIRLSRETSVGGVVCSADSDKTSSFNVGSSNALCFSNDNYPGTVVHLFHHYKKVASSFVEEWGRTNCNPSEYTTCKAEGGYYQLQLEKGERGCFTNLIGLSDYPYNKYTAVYYYCKEEARACDESTCSSWTYKGCGSAYGCNADQLKATRTCTDADCANLGQTSSCLNWYSSDYPDCPGYGTPPPSDGIPPPPSDGDGNIDDGDEGTTGRLWEIPANRVNVPKYIKKGKNPAISFMIYNRQADSASTKLEAYYIPLSHPFYQTAKSSAGQQIRTMSLLGYDLITPITSCPTQFSKTHKAVMVGLIPALSDKTFWIDVPAPQDSGTYGLMIATYTDCGGATTEAAFIEGIVITDDVVLPDKEPNCQDLLDEDQQGDSDYIDEDCNPIDEIKSTAVNINEIDGMTTSDLQQHLCLTTSDCSSGSCKSIAYLKEKGYLTSTKATSWVDYIKKYTGTFGIFKYILDKVTENYEQNIGICVIEEKFDFLAWIHEQENNLNLPENSLLIGGAIFIFIFLILLFRR